VFISDPLSHGCELTAFRLSHTGMALHGAGVGPLGWASLRFSMELGGGPCRGRRRITSCKNPHRPARPSVHRSAIAVWLRPNHFEIGLAAPWTLQLEDDLAGFDLVHEVCKSPVTSGASHLSLENVHPVPSPFPVRAHDTPSDRIETVGSGGPRINPLKDGFFSIFR
jgi:hypothetical protein